MCHLDKFTVIDSLILLIRLAYRSYCKCIHNRQCSSSSSEYSTDPFGNITLYDASGVIAGGNLFPKIQNVV